jgi:hypothetical protein
MVKGRPNQLTLIHATNYLSAVRAKQDDIEQVEIALCFCHVSAHDGPGASILHYRDRHTVRHYLRHRIAVLLHCELFRQRIEMLELRI